MPPKLRNSSWSPAPYSPSRLASRSENALIEPASAVLDRLAQSAIADRVHTAVTRLVPIVGPPQLKRTEDTQPQTRLSGLL